MAGCDEMKVGEVYTCLDCGLDFETSRLFSRHPAIRNTPSAPRASPSATSTPGSARQRRAAKAVIADELLCSVRDTKQRPRFQTQRLAEP